jgi:hypothetical protein
MIYTVRIPLTLEFNYRADNEMTLDEIHNEIRLFLQADNEETLDITSYHWEA